MIKSFNKQIAVEPIQAQVAQKSRRVAGMEIIDEKVSLVPLKVVFSSNEHNIYEDDVIYVDGNAALNQSWSRKVYEIDSKTFILVPVEQLVLLSTNGDSV